MWDSQLGKGYVNFDPTMVEKLKHPIHKINNNNNNFTISGNLSLPQTPRGKKKLNKTKIIPDIRVGSQFMQGHGNENPKIIIYLLNRPQVSENPGLFIKIFKNANSLYNLKKLN